MSKAMFWSPPRWFVVGVLMLGCGAIHAESTDLAADLQAFAKPKQGSFRVAEGEGPAGGPALRVRAVAPDWNGLLTRDFSVPAGAVSAELSGQMMTEKVVGSGQSFTAARAQLVFLNNRGSMVGGWPSSTDVQGTTAWKAFSQTHKLPPGTAYVRLNLGLYNAVGLAKFSDIQLTLRDASGKKMELGPPPQAESTDTTTWRPFGPQPFRPDSTPVLDIPKILGVTGPAGAHGFLGAKNGRFVFADGTPVRFWATNFGVSDNWRPEAESAAAVERIRRMGFNMVRLHHLDAGWAKESLFDETKDNTQSFEPGRLDRFFRMLGQLRNAGVYYYLDLLVTRKFKSGDGVRDAEALDFGAKIAGQFNRRLIELQKDYARQILTTVNPHTGLKLADDPALALVAIINESSLFLQGAVGSYEQLPKSYIEELNALYAAWREKNQLPPVAKSVPALLKSRDSQVVVFLRETQDAYYAEMRSFLRDELGVKVPIIGSNFQEVVADARSNALLDVYDVHAYWDHPQGGWSAEAPISNTPLVQALPKKNSPFHKIAAQRFSGMPMFVSEWQACWPNETQFEGPLLFATMASLQGWQGLANFGFSESDWSPRMSGVFASGQRPNTTAALPTAALIFRRDDIARLPVQKFPLGKDPMETVGTDLDAGWLLTHALEVDDGAPLPGKAQEGSEWIGAGEVQWKNPGLLRINAPRVAGVLGSFDESPIPAGAFEFRMAIPFAQAVVISLTPDDLTTSKRLLIQAVARAENTAMEYRPFRKGLQSSGTPPILMEPIKGSVSWTPPTGASLTLTEVDWNGDTVAAPKPLAVDTDGRATVDFSNLSAASAIIEISSPK